MLHTFFSWKICYVGLDFSIKAWLAYEWLLDSIAGNVFCWYIFCQPCMYMLDFLKTIYKIGIDRGTQTNTNGHSEARKKPHWKSKLFIMLVTEIYKPQIY